ncbi:MAG: type II toxin-antitoxin system Phd/YefM family antitoxin [Proteobacteria bacterium]|nr:type II toxin-antitoxin system Phd/YefM family antitoxin [Pseudomonadota bacterium]
MNSNKILPTFSNTINKTYNPTVLTINGKAEAVLLDPKSYQKMINKIAELESANKIKSALKEMENKQGIPVQKAFQKLRKKITRK